jgi:hypothetical protein
MILAHADAMALIEAVHMLANVFAIVAVVQSIVMLAAVALLTRGRGRRDFDGD